MLQVIVSHRQEAALDVAAFEFVSAAALPLPAFEPGAHIDVHLPNGLVRQYSLLGDCADRSRYEIAVLWDRQGRGGSASAYHDLHSGQTVTISEPRNLFPLVTAERTLLFAGGIGITPIMAMAQALHRAGQSFQLYYCGRSLDRMAFVDRLNQAPFADRVHFYPDDGPDKVDFTALLSQPDKGTHLYICGPQGFMEAVLSTARAGGWNDANLHREYFNAAPVEGGGEFNLKLARSQRTIAVKADQTAVAALAEAGIEIPVSCEQGVCGTCRLTLLEGIPDHRDVFLTDDERVEGRSFLPCCSRALSPELVIDL